MTNRSRFRYFKTSVEIIYLAEMYYVRFPLSLRNVEDLLHEHGIDVGRETARNWRFKFGWMFASEIKKRRMQGRKSSHWRRPLDEVFVRTNVKQHYLWGAVDYDGEVLESCIAKERDKRAALIF